MQCKTHYPFSLCLKIAEIYVIVDKSAYFAKNNFFVCVFDFRFLFLPNIAQNGKKN